MKIGKPHSVALELEKRLLLMYSFMEYTLEDINKIYWDIEDEEGNEGDIDCQIYATQGSNFQIENIQIKTRPKSTKYWRDNDFEILKGFNQLFQRFISEKNDNEVARSYTLLLDVHVESGAKGDKLRFLSTTYLDRQPRENDSIPVFLKEKFQHHGWSYEDRFETNDHLLLELNKFTDVLTVSYGFTQNHLFKNIEVIIPEIKNLLYTLESTRELNKETIELLFLFKSQSKTLNDVKTLTSQIQEKIKRNLKIENSLMILKQLEFHSPLSVYQKTNEGFEISIPSRNIKDIEPGTPFHLVQLINEFTQSDLDSEHEIFLGSAFLHFATEKMLYLTLDQTGPKLDQVLSGNLGDDWVGRVLDTDIIIKSVDPVIDLPDCIELVTKYFDRSKEILLEGIT